MTISQFRSFLIFLLPFTMIFEVAMVGRFIVAEFVTMVAVPLLIFYSKEYKSKEFFLFFTFLSIWLFGQIVTDFIRDTPFVDYSRGWSKILVFGMNFFALSMIVNGNLHRAILLFVSLSFGIALRLYVGLNDVIDVDASLADKWKFGFGAFLTIMGFVVSAHFLKYRETKPLGIVVSFIFPIVALLMNSRSLFGMAALAAVLAAIVATQRRALKVSEVLIVAAALLIAGWGALSVYSYTAERGYLGVDAAQKFQNQRTSDGGLIGIILGGRIEPLGSFEAVKDSPIIGHGSWAKNPYYINLMLYKARQLGIRYEGTWYSDSNIPSHSYIMGAWVEAGIFGAIFWAWAIYLVATSFFHYVRNPDPFSGLIMFVLIGFLWNILFSPFGLEARLYTAAILVLLMGVRKTSAEKSLAAKSRSIGTKGHAQLQKATV